MKIFQFIVLRIVKDFAKIILEKKSQAKINQHIKLYQKAALHIIHQESMLVLLIGKEMKKESL